MRIRGVRGLNRFDFLGRIGRRSVRPGIYILSLTRASSRRPVGQPLLVQVVSARRTILLGDAQARRAACDGSSGVDARGWLAAFTPPGVTPPAKTSTPPPPEQGHVLGARVGLPPLPTLDEGQPVSFAAAVLIIGVPFLLLLVLVVRFLRDSWSP